MCGARWSFTRTATPRAAMTAHQSIGIRFDCNGICVRLQEKGCTTAGRVRARKECATAARAVAVSAQGRMLGIVADGLTRAAGPRGRRNNTRKRSSATCFLGNSESPWCQIEVGCRSGRAGHLPWISHRSVRAMNARERAAWKKKLEAMRQEALGKGAIRIEPNRKDATDTGIADEDAQALSEMLQAIGSQRNRGQAERIARIDRALRKIEDDPDQFGVCDECGEAIAPKRLEVMPDAALCMECQGARDPRRGTTRKKLTDYQ